jgi:hypothetical protein
MPALIETWPLAADARWRVLAWPNWRNEKDLKWIFRELGPALAENEACLCLRHDPDIDGKPENARARMIDVAERAGSIDGGIRVAIIDGPLSDDDWEGIAACMNAKIAPPTWPQTARLERIDRVHAFELRTSGDVRRLLTDQPEITPFDEFRRLFAGVPGWFTMQAACIWDSLLNFQSSSKVSGHFLEIGVWKGRSALLSTLHASEDEECVYVDMLPIEEARANLRSVRTSGLHFIRATSRNLVAAMLPESATSGYRWIHIDGEHSGIAVEHDLAFASSLLGERGIIVIDDFFTPSYPQITFAVLDHLRAHPKSLVMFLCGFNKAYLCHPSDARWLLTHVANNMVNDMVERGTSDVTLFKTADPLDLNCFGLDIRGVNERFRGPDWDKDLLLY